MIKLDKIRQIVLLLFVYSLPFEYWNPFGISSIFTISKSLGILYFILSTLNIKLFFTIKYVKKPITVLLIIWLLLLFQSIFNYWPGSKMSVYNFSFLQNIALFWLVSNDLIRNKRLLPKLFSTLLFGVLTMGVLISFGIGLDTSIDTELGTYRLSFFGSNPNTIGNLAAISLFLSGHMLLNRKKYFGNATLLVVLFIPVFLNLLIFSGSRGSAIISIASIFLLFLFKKENSFKRVFFVILGIGIVFFLLSKMMESELMANRLTTGLEEGGLGGRMEIWKAAFDIFLDYPFLGKGVTGFEYEMLNRYTLYMDTHNLFIYFMVTIGFIGLCLYIYILLMLTKSAFKYYKFQNDAVLISLLAIYLLLAFKSGDAINSKVLWLLTAFIYGAGQIHQFLTLDKKS